MGQNWYGAGELWKRDVETRAAPSETRKEFYGDKAIRKVGGKLIGDSAKNLTPEEIVVKLKEREDITKDEKILSSKWAPDKVKEGRYVSHILADFFAKACGSKRATADTLIALKYLNTELDNVDWVQNGETVEIENGILTIKSGDDVVARCAILPREKLPAGSPEALSRRGGIKRKTKKALAGVRRQVGVAQEARAEAGTLAPETALSPEPAKPTDVPAAPVTAPGRAGELDPEPAREPGAAAGSSREKKPKEEAGRKPVTAPPREAGIKRASDEPDIPPLPRARTLPGAPEQIPEPKRKELEATVHAVKNIKIKGYEIVQTKTGDDGAEFEVRKGEKVVAELTIHKENPKSVRLWKLLPAYNLPKPDRVRIGTFEDIKNFE